ncbi:conserved Plasmodium protein, unknown function [Plasmodium knowlesi strain H]|uniref:Poly(A) RNA polymerase mitochondrial-like central palm domain-containing protein n=3 Tax=Plasmodium knowlesi TaxID=5850 RepID=A0A5K1TZB5_PLAKH|nr:conserved Plasmodium protein, unknown function [Plasmodium knowlesi strain H]OTN63745.1 Uncharacterized protein PKNOH_S140264900 [Plasmodium knowlesi]CAA9991063.1 conserved Plasmodium protein, unknown function [Plasmodium knowlesi strain H]SBO20647.1 conserved Plasmodium protein, unknown function [Plasmodium knowlesi strain H]SBO21062.1 conserved Plasmodium protein, unknown function [Plasmodium knowlesi strain H]VVS80537.1 conserved Plasmodium protein, unknown function [Plasmodium knowlesi |eukprot:XP_002262345.1 hypothetical protein, conserved in Plasmodium species [Plasmodium knowlesi strain H]
MTKGKRINRGMMGGKVKLSKKKKFAKKMDALKGKLYRALGERLSGDEGGKRHPPWETKISGWTNRTGHEPTSQANRDMEQKMKKQQKGEKRVHKDEEEEHQFGRDPYRSDPFRGKSHPRAINPDRYNDPHRKEHKVKRIDGVDIEKKRGTPHRMQLRWLHEEHEKSLIHFMKRNQNLSFNNYLDDLRRVYFCTGKTTDTYRMMIRDMDTNMRAILGVKHQHSRSAPPERSPASELSLPGSASLSTSACASSAPCAFPVGEDQVNHFVEKQYLLSSTIELFYNLGKEVMYLTELMKSRRHEIAMRQKLLKEVQIFIKAVYPQVYLLIFGSCNTELDLYNSDIDICIYNNVENDRTNIRKLYNEMKRNKLFQNATIKQIIGAKVPIIKCFFTHIQISIDFSFNQVSAIVSTVETQSFLKKNPLIKYVVIFFKIVLSEYNLNDAFQGGISSFKLFLILVKFLKEHVFVFYEKNIYLYIGEVVHKFVSYLSLFRDKSDDSMASFFSAIYNYNIPTQAINQSTQFVGHAPTPFKPTLQLVKRRSTKVIKKLFNHIFCKLGLANQNFNEKKGDFTFDKLFQVRQSMKEVLYSLADMLIYLVRKKNKNISPEYDTVIFSDALSIVAFFHFLREERLNRFLRDTYRFLHHKVVSLSNNEIPIQIPPTDHVIIDIYDESKVEVTQEQYLPPEVTRAEVNAPNGHLSDTQEEKHNHNTHSDGPIDDTCDKTGNMADHLVKRSKELPSFLRYFQCDTFDEVQANVNHLYLSMGHKINNQNRFVKKICSKLVIINSMMDLNKLLSNRFHYHQIFLPSTEERKCKDPSTSPHEGGPQDLTKVAALKRQMLASLVRFKNYDPSEVMGFEIKNEFFVNSASTVFK